MTLKYRTEIVNAHPHYSPNASPVQLESAAFNRSSTQVSNSIVYATYIDMCREYSLENTSTKGSDTQLLFKCHNVDNINFVWIRSAT